MSKKCVLLVRVSTDAQDLTQQTEKVKQEALKDGFTDENIIIIEDKESAVKLSEEERNGLNRLKHHIENDTIECVYTYELSRISVMARCQKRLTFCFHCFHQWQKMKVICVKYAANVELTVKRNLDFTTVETYPWVMMWLMISS